MKKFCLFFACTLWISFLAAQEKLPGRDSKEWNNLTVAQRWQAVNIPEDQLNKMTTNELIEHCINFNFMWDIFNYPDYDTGLNIVIEKHNGLRELLNRKDAGKLLLNYYKKIDPNKIAEIIEPGKRGEFAGKIFFLELFLSHPNILNQLQNSEKELIKAFLISLDICRNINSSTGSDYYSGYSIGTKVLAMGRALNHLRGNKTGDPATGNMDLSKLSNENFEKIVKEARML